MSNFAYTIRDVTGRSLKGTIEARDASAASRLLRERGAVILNLAPAVARAARGGSGVTGHAPWRTRLNPPSSASIEVGLKQMGVMLRSGLTLLETLKSVGEQTTSRPLKRALAEVAADVRAGGSLTAAFKARGCFSRMVTQLCEIGEQTGQLDLVLERAADALERRRMLGAQIIAALLYPAIVFLASVAVTVFILVYAIPRISVYLRALGRPLPPMTQRLVDLSDLLVTQWPMLLGGVALASVLFGVTYSAPAGRLLIDSITLRVPLVGYILRTGATAAFSRSLAILLSSGVTIIESLRTCQDLHGNRRLALTIARAREAIIGGDALAPSFRRRAFADVAFMPMLAGMVAAGEKSGRLDQTLLECATFHEQRLASLIRVLSSVIEIAVVVLVGGIVGYVYLAFMVALYGAAL